MKKNLIGLGTVVLFLAFVWVSMASAQSGDDGYPIETEVPTEEPTIEPTQEPTRVSPQEPTREPTQLPTREPIEESLETPEPMTLNPVCDGTRIHPVLYGFTILYDVSYDELFGYFCNDHLGIGEIALALKTVERLEGVISLEELLAQRVNDEYGWGEIWQSLGMMENGRNNNTYSNNDQPEGLAKNKNRNIFQDSSQSKNQ